MNDHSDQRRPTRRVLVFAANYGAVVAYLVVGGNPVWMLVVMIVIGVLFRLYTCLLIRRRGLERPPWWKVALNATFRA